MRGIGVGRFAGAGAAQLFEDQHVAGMQVEHPRGRLRGGIGRRRRQGPLVEQGRPRGAPRQAAFVVSPGIESDRGMGTAEVKLRGRIGHHRFEYLVLAGRHAIEVRLPNDIAA